MEIISVTLNAVLTGIIILLAISFFLLIRRNIKNKKIVDCISAFDDEDYFFQKIDMYLETVKGAEFNMKGKILKLWGVIFYKRYTEVDLLLDAIDFIPLKEDKGIFKKNKLQLNEDSLYYFCLASINTLYGRNEKEYLQKFKTKLIENKSILQGNLVYEIAKESFQLFENKDDCGEKFFTRVYEGDYAEYKYAKQLIGIYKMICESYLTHIYLVNNRIDEYEKIKEDIIAFNATKIGHRYLSELNIDESWLIRSEEPIHIDTNEDAK